jgi:predicted acetyltransferase
LADTEELARLNLELMVAEDYDQKLPLEELIPRMSSFLQTEYDAFYIMFEGKKAGYILIKTTSKPLYIRQFYILPQFQRNGLGQRTIKALQEQYNTKTFDVEVMAWNEVGFNFWKKADFKLRCYSMRLN